MTFSADDALEHARKLADRGETGKARQLYQTILQHFPDRPEAEAELAALSRRSARMAMLTALQEKGDFAAVVEEGEPLAEAFPRAAVLANLLGIAHASLNQPERAIVHFTRAIRVRPELAEIHVNLGKALGAAGRKEDAAASFLAAARLNSRHADAHFSLGLVLAQLGRHQDAADAFRNTLALDPRNAGAEIGLGNAFRELGLAGDAADCFTRAVKLAPDNIDAHIHLANIHRQQRRTAQAVATLDAALALAPDRDDARALKLFLAAVLCDWDTLDREAAAIPGLGIAGKAVEPFMLLALEDEPARHRLRAERFALERCAQWDHAPIARPSAPPARLRLGYFSADFHNHAVLFQLIRVLELHDRARFEIHAYSFGPGIQDAMRARVMKAVDAFRDVRALDARTIAEQARADGIDIAIDLMGFTRNARPQIFAHRAAPVQISWLGYPGTMGTDFMDYLIADRMIVPRAQRAHYAEKIIFLPRVQMAVDDTKPIAASTVTRRDAGLPQTGFVFASFNNSYKISPAQFGIWMRLLAKVPDSVLWLAGAEEGARRNLKHQAQARGIDPARLIFAERIGMADHLARHAHADLFLDTFPYCGHSTAADALWAGLPLVTRTGHGFASRVAASLLAVIGLPELIAETDEDYERLALELAQDPARLAHIRRRLGDNKARLFDSEKFTRELETGYRKAWQGWFDGRAVEDIVVAPGESSV